MIKDDFNYFMGERIEGCIRDLKKTNKKYMEEKEKYSKLYEKLSSTLNKTKSNELDVLLEQLFYTIGFEREAIYLTGIQDVNNIMSYKLKDIH